MRQLLIAFVAAINFHPMLAAAELRFFDDAALHDVQFADTNEGWAVGDDGVVLHTIDGGQRWERQPTGVRASLRSVHFLKNNPYFGWIAGRQELPRGKGSVGVLLFTTDGGVKWTPLLENSLPGLNRVVFVDPQTGYVFGDGSDQFPTGLFKTIDSGRTWEPVKGPRSASWLAGAFTDRDEGMLAGAWSRLAALRPEGFGTTDVDPLDGRNILDVHLASERAFAVGQGGLILSSQTRGSRWGFVDLKMPLPMLACLDFHGIHGAGMNLWVVGRPGSVILHSKDGGASWQMQATNQPLPLNAVHFADDKCGWAVGELGAILATTDGGNTWTPQRHGGRHAAVLLVHADARATPVDSVALLGADQGYYVAALRVLAPDSTSAALAESTADLRLAAAARQVGGVAGEMLWHFPVPQHLRDVAKKDLLRHWDTLHDNAAVEHLLRQLVLALRVWQPHVVVTDDPGTAEAAAALVGEALSKAVALAGDATAFPEQLQLGLKPCRPTRVFCVTDQRERAQVVMNCQEARAGLHASARDFAHEAAAMLHDATLPDERMFRNLDAAAATPTQLLEGLFVGEEARRKRDETPELTREMKDAIILRRSLEVMAHQSLRGEANEAAKALAQIGPLLTKLPDDQGAAAALAMGNQYARSGQWALARETFLLMIERYPVHPLSANAYRWLIQHNSSSEARCRHQLEHFLLVGKSTFTDPNAKALVQSGGEKEKPGTVTQAVMVGKASTLQNPIEARQWHHGSLKIAQQLVALGPVHGFDPAIQFCLQSSRRQLGDAEKTNEWYSRFHNYYPGGVWHEAAAAETWLMNRSLPPGKAVAECRLADAPPFLDGKFDDPCWQNRQPLRLANATEQSRLQGEKTDPLTSRYPTAAWFAFDQKFLYVAIRCEHPAADFVPKEKARKRDDDLRPYDRVSIMLDLDRDYSTYFNLQIDQRGCAREECWGDATWNPRWFVAVASDESGWNVEAAIPMTELSADRITLNSAWACNIVRALPGRGVQAWSRPADVEPRPEGMAILLFQRPPEQKERP